ncbi:hypothetical protein ACOYW6_03085 [Parablastomonas sp. CN1-191]|uniref:hypothetical protein n=1 Tax=Parablastomonas sp. CN1-191 TaxID=3400908 RepID=UPI003BF8D8CE
MHLPDALVVIALVGAVAHFRGPMIKQHGWRRAFRDAPFARRDGRTMAPADITDDRKALSRQRELEDEVEALRERVHVLERIATDGRRNQDLAAEIEKLREQRI